jgi:Tol biopolymer transport system component
MNTKLLIAVLTLLWFQVAVAQEFDFPHASLEWRTIETEHFLVHYHNGTQRTANEVAYIAEQIYAPVTELYHHMPDQKVSFVIRDHDDYSNGAAYFFENRVELWAPAMNFELRGAHPWLWDVVTHEFTHLVQIQTQMKFGRKVPAVYFQWLGYERERRSDVLYGFPNVIVSYPISGFVLPSWFAEGVAQYNAPNLNYDYWDSHRDMILRMYMLDGNPLSWEEMAVFGKTSLGNESSYNAGFSIVSYIAETYGPDKLEQLSRALGRINRVTIDGAIEDVLGKTGEELYNEWRTKKTRDYRERAALIQSSLKEGKLIEADGFGNFYPAFSPDGKKIAYISNKGKDYFQYSSIYLYEFATGDSKKIQAGVRSTISFSPDGKFLYYAKLSYDNPEWSRFSDLYRYDIESDEETRLTHALRAFSPKLSHDGSKIVFSSGSDGTTNIGIVETDGTNPRFVTRFTDGEQANTPVWSPDGASIAFAYSHGFRRSVMVTDTQGTTTREIDGGAYDARDPFYSLAGSQLLYASDQTGIFNIYSYDLKSGGRKQLTNVLGGAFLPTVNADGDIAYASYASSGYKISLMMHDSNATASPPTTSFTVASSDSVNQTPASILDAGPRLTKRQDAQALLSRPYANTYTDLMLIPVLRIDAYNKDGNGWDFLKPGIYFASSEVLNKLSMFGGISLNRKLERDLFFIFEYRAKLPLLYQLGLQPALSLEGYNISRATTVMNDLYYPHPPFSMEVRFNLLEFDLRFKHPVVNELTMLEAYYSISRYDADYASYTHPDNAAIVVPAFKNTYLIGQTFGIRLTHNGVVPSSESAINPQGRFVALRYTFEANKFNPKYEVKDGMLAAVYNRFDFNRVELKWNEYIPFLLDKHTFGLTIQAGTIVDKNVDPFFNFYAGGLIGMRSYPFYSIGGNSMAAVTASYRFPILAKINYNILQLNLTRLYGSFFADYGNAWTGGKIPKSSDWKSGAGFELRLEAFSFYAYPTRIFFSGAYGFKKFDQTFETQTSTETVSYGKEWRFYFGVLFDFEFRDFLPRNIM